MDELDPRVAALIDLGREAHDPTAADEARVRAALGVAIGGGGASGDPAPAPTTTAASAVKWWLGLALVGGGVGLFAALSRPQPVHELDRAGQHAPAASARAPAPAQTAPPSARVELPGAEIAPAPTAPSAATPQHRPTLSLPSTPSHSQPAQPVAAGPSELTLIRDATRALRDGRASDALSLLAEHERRFPAGVLTEERSGLHVLTLCALGRNTQGRAERERFLERAPASPLAGRVRAACGPEGQE